MSKLCIIPARGGSKRIPKKNIKLFLGKPIIAYSIDAAIQSNLFDEVMVSTDDNEIAKVAKKYGAKLPFMRSNENADDHATTFQVIEEVLIKYKERGETYTQVCCLYPCAPFVSAERLIEAHLKLEKFETVIPVVKYSFPIQRALKIVDKESLEFFQPEYELARSQDLESSYHDAGQFYWLNIESLLKHKSIMSKKTGAIILSEIEAQDIDNVIDWKLAELKYKIKHEVS